MGVMRVDKRPIRPYACRQRLARDMWKESPAMSDDLRIGDVVQMRKTHPCGSDRWRVYRVGADIGLRCLGCTRRVMLPRRKFVRAMKRVIRTDDTSDGNA